MLSGIESRSVFPDHMASKNGNDSDSKAEIQDLQSKFTNLNFKFDEFKAKMKDILAKFLETGHDERGIGKKIEDNLNDRREEHHNRKSSEYQNQGDSTFQDGRQLQYHTQHNQSELMNRAPPHHEYSLYEHHKSYNGWDEMK